MNQSVLVTMRISRRRVWAIDALRLAARCFVVSSLLHAHLISGAAADELKIVVVAPLTGPSSKVGEGVLTGAERAVQDLGTRTLPGGASLHLSALDDACDPEQALAIAQKLATERPALIIGHVCSSTSLVAAPVYAAAGIIEISPSATAQRLTEMGLPSLFRTIGRDDHEGIEAGSLLARRWAGKRIALLDDGSTYGVSLADATYEELQRRGVTAAWRQVYEPNAPDYRGLIAGLKARAIDVVYLGGYAQDVGLIIREARATGFNAAFLGGDALSDATFGLVAGSSGEGAAFTFAPLPEQLGANAEILAGFRRNHVEPDFYALSSYAAVQAWAAALVKTGSADPKLVAAALHAGRFDTVLGPIGFDNAGDLTGPSAGWVWYRWHDGKVEAGPP